MEEEKKEIKKSNNVLVIVLCLIICLLVAFIAYDKVIVNQKTNDKEENEKVKKEEKETELKESDVLDYITNINNVLVTFGDKVPLKTTDISNDEILEFAFWKAEWSGEKKTAQAVAKVIEEIFGKDYSYKLGDIQCLVGDGVIYRYNQAEGTYTRVGEHGHGGNGGFRPRIYFVEGKQTSDTITIEAKVLYGEHCGDICGPATDFYSKATTDRNEIIYHVKDESHYDDYDFVYNEVKDQLPITTFTLKKQSDGRFALSEIK